MKLANTFITCTGYTGMQWQHVVKGHVLSQLTLWRDKRGVHSSSFGSVSEADFNKAYNKFMAL